MTMTSQFTSVHEPQLLPRHLKVTGANPAFGYEPCEDVGCAVASDGEASSCRRVACPACGCGGTNLSTIALVDSLTKSRLHCSCGYSWIREEQLVYGLTQH